MKITNKKKKLITNKESTKKIKKEALKNGYEPLEIDGIRKVIDGITNMKELDKKLLIM